MQEQLRAEFDRLETKLLETIQLRVREEVERAIIHKIEDSASRIIISQEKQTEQLGKKIEDSAARATEQLGKKIEDSAARTTEQLGKKIENSAARTTEQLGKKIDQSTEKLANKIEESAISQTDRILESINVGNLQTHELLSNIAEIMNKMNNTLEKKL